MSQNQNEEHNLEPIFSIESLLPSFSQPNMKRSQSQGFAPLTLPAFQQAVNIGKAAEEKSKLLLHKGKHSTGKLKLDEGEFDFQADDLVDHVSCLSSVSTGLH